MSHANVVKRAGKLTLNRSYMQVLEDRLIVYASLGRSFTGFYFYFQALNIIFYRFNKTRSPLPLTQPQFRFKKNRHPSKKGMDTSSFQSSSLFTHPTCKKNYKKK